MDTRSPLTKRIEIHFDAYSERNIIKFLDKFPSKMGFIKELVYREYRKYKRYPNQYARQHGLAPVKTGRPPKEK